MTGAHSDPHSLQSRFDAIQEDHRVDLPARLDPWYTIISCLKHTPHQQVYLLAAKGEDTRYILKIASGIGAHFLKEEYAHLMRLHTPYMPRVVMGFGDETRWYLLREYIPGITLHQMVESNGPLPPSEAINLTIQVCTMVKWLHEQTPPTIHRDIKAQNIVITPEGACRFIDLGSARVYTSGKTQDTVLMVTQATAAPEQYGFKQTDARTDVYAIGGLLAFLLTGNYATDEPLPADIPKYLTRVITKCLSFDPEKRYQTVGELLESLKRLTRRKKTTRQWLLYAAGILSVALVLFLSITQGIRYTAQAHFAEPLIADAVRVQLDLPPGAPILKERLAEVQTIVVCGDTTCKDYADHMQYARNHHVHGTEVGEWTRGTVKSLDDLRMLPNLQYLVVDKQEISDLTPLMGLPLLRVTLCQNRITDISPLASCEQLQYLSLEDNDIKNVMPLRALANLFSLDLSGNPMEGVSPLTVLPRLGALKLLNMPAAFSYSELGTMKLQALNINAPPQEVIDDILRMDGMLSLTIYSLEEVDVGTFASLRKLNYLDLCFANTIDLSRLGELPQLEGLSIAGAHLTGLEGLHTQRQLMRLNIGNVRIDDLTPLAQLPATVILDVSEDMYGRIMEEIPNHRFAMEKTWHAN